MKKLFILAVILLLIPSTIQAEEVSNWHAWAYAEATDTLLLFNRDGDILQMNTPADPQASIDAPTFVGVSRDGVTMVVLTFSNNNSPLVIFQNLNTKVQFSWKGTPDETFLANLDGSYSVPSVTFSQDGSLFALGLSNFNAWRVVIFTVNNGQAAVEVNQNYAYLQEIMAVTGQFVLPVVRLFDEQGVHVQLVNANTEGLETYPAFLWQWNGSVVPSNYVDAKMDIDPQTSEIVFPAVDEASPLPDPVGPDAAYNAIDTTTAETMLVIEDEIVNRTRWANGTNAVLFETTNPDTFETLWNVIRLDDPNAVIMDLISGYADVRGTPDGFLSVEADTGIINFHAIADPYSPQPITAIQTGDAAVEIIWVSSEGYEYLGPQ